MFLGLFTSEDGVISAPEGSIITEDGSLVAADGTVLAPPGSIVTEDHQQTQQHQVSLVFVCLCGAAISYLCSTF